LYYSGDLDHHLSIAKTATIIQKLIISIVAIVLQTRLESKSVFHIATQTTKHITAIVMDNNHTQTDANSG
jgi:hypothetical protein